jgi:hypothetical protein
MGNFLCFNCSEKSGKQNNLIGNRNYFYINENNININNFIKLYEIGKGAFGIVKNILYIF